MKALKSYLPCREILACFVAVVLTVGLCVPAYADPTEEEVTSSPSMSAEDEQGQDEAADTPEFADDGEGVESENDSSLDSAPNAGDASPSADESIQDEGVESDSDDEDVEPFSLRSTSSIWSFDYDQGVGTVVEFEFPNVQNLINSSKADAVRIKASMRYDGVVTRNITAQATLSEVVSAGNKIRVDFEDYGKFSVTVSYLKNGRVASSENVFDLGVVSDRYVIAPICSTYPLTAFSLSFRNAMGQGVSAPAIVLLERPDAYDWSKLPSDMYTLPYLSDQDGKIAPSDSTAARKAFTNRCSAFAAYVGDLFEMNPNAQFDFWFSDSCLGLAHSLVYANNIQNYSMTILSDSDSTFENYKTAYGTIDPNAKHETLVEAWNVAKANASSKGSVDAGFEIQNASEYLIALLECEKDAHLWVPSKDGFNCGNAAFDEAVRANSQIIEKDIAGLLAGLQSQGNGAVSEFDELYKLGSDCFSEAEASGKRPMILLDAGSAQVGEFVDCAALAKLYYGDEFAYFCSADIAGFFGGDAVVSEAFGKLGLTILDEAVPVEVALKLHPDTAVSGFDSASAALGTMRMLFGSTKKDALASGGAGSTAEAFVSKVGTGTDPKIAALCEAGKKWYLVEFSDAMLKGKDFEFALWNATDGELKYYRLSADGKPEQPTDPDPDGPNTPDNPDSPDNPSKAFDGGLRTIETSLRSSMLVDVKSASTASGANVQLYGGNSTPAQRFRFEKAGDGYFEIVNVKSGLVLDVQSAGKRSGTNVWQYGRNGTDAQKWQVVPTGDSDGSYYIISKCNGLYLDVKSGKTGNGNNIQVYQGNKTPAQKFHLNTVGPVIPSGTYTFRSTLNPSKALDVSNASSANGANVQLFQDNGTKAQKLQVLFDANTGYYTCKFLCSGKMLDVAGGKTNDRTNVQQYAGNATWAQKWAITKDSSGRFCVRASASGKALDVSNGRTANKTNIWIYPTNNTKAQLWYIDRV